MRCRVLARPNSAVDAVVEQPDGSLLVRVRAPAREDRANEAVAELLARHYRVPRGKVRLAAGRRGRHKVFEVSG